MAAWEATSGKKVCQVARNGKCEPKGDWRRYAIGCAEDGMADGKKACKVNGGNFQDSVNWSATVNGEIIKSYCPWVWQNANRKKHCKQKQNNVL